MQFFGFSDVFSSNYFKNYQKTPRRSKVIKFESQKSRIILSHLKIVFPNFRENSSNNLDIFLVQSYSF